MTAEPDLLPLPEMDIYALGSGVGLRDVRHTPVGFSQKKMSEYARACVAHATAARDAEVEALRAEVDEWKDVARCASEQQDSLFREACELNERADKLRSEVESVNSWNARVSVCRDHVADIVDGPCVICVLDAVEAYADRMWAEADRLAKEVIRVQQQYDERTACVIVHRGSALACSDAVRDAYLDEHHRAERLAELLDQAYGYVPSGTLADQIHCALTKGYGNDV